MDKTGQMWLLPNSHQLKREEVRSRKVIKIQALEEELRPSQTAILHLKDYLKDQSINICFTFGMENTRNSLSKLKLWPKAMF